MTKESPLVCDMSVLTGEEREGHIRVTTQLLEAIQSVREMQNGYEFVFPNKSEHITQIAEFIARERLCCPFLEFGLNVKPNEPSMVLSLRGPAGTQEFLRAEFEEAFQ